MTILSDRVQHQLKGIYRRQMEDPSFSQLRLPGRNFVPGRGSMTPDLVFIGEAPGFHENEERKPFVGPAGDVFRRLLSTLGQLQGKRIFVTNVVKWQPPRNRTPFQSEIDASLPYLLREIAVLNPTHGVVTMGATALKALRGPQSRVSQCHGVLVPNNRAKRPMASLYHPARVAYDEDEWPVLKDDFRIVLTLLGLQ